MGYKRKNIINCKQCERADDLANIIRYLIRLSFYYYYIYLLFYLFIYFFLFQFLRSGISVVDNRGRKINLLHVQSFR